MDMSMTQGLLYFAACIPIGIVGLISARYQGETAAASIAMVETYAILALLISILAVSAL